MGALTVRLPEALDFNALECLAALGQYRGLASKTLIATDDGVAVERVVFDDPGRAPAGLSGDQRRTGPANGSSTRSPRFEQSLIASATSAVGFTVGCMASA